MGRITIKDIARLLDVNPSTVSRALKDHPDISQETKEMIQNLAKELGYRPNHQAIHFRNRKSGLIGLIIPHMEMFFFPYVVQAVEEVCRSNGYNLIVFQSNESLEKEIENALICQNFGIDGLLVSVSKETYNIDHFQEISDKNVPVVYFDKIINKKDIPKVVIDDKQEAFKAVSYLVNKGFKIISGIFDSPKLTISKERFAGFKEALEVNHLPLHSELCIFSEGVSGTKEAFIQLLKNPTPPDAVFAMSDELLVGVMQAVHQCGIRVPDDLGIIAISNGQIPYYFNPQITFIQHSGYEVGKEATAFLFSLIFNRREPEQKAIQIETKMVELGSV